MISISFMLAVIFNIDRSLKSHYKLQAEENIPPSIMLKKILRRKS